jgi:hypothetical protein
MPNVSISHLTNEAASPIESIMVALLDLKRELRVQAGSANPLARGMSSKKTTRRARGA